MSETEIFELMRDILAKEFEISGESVQPSAKMIETLDLDSLDVISLVQVIGDAVGVGLDEDDVRDCETLGDLASRVAGRVSKGR